MIMTCTKILGLGVKKRFRIHHNKHGVKKINNNDGVYMPWKMPVTIVSVIVKGTRFFDNITGTRQTSFC